MCGHSVKERRLSGSVDVPLYCCVILLIDSWIVVVIFFSIIKVLTPPDFNGSSNTTVTWMALELMNHKDKSKVIILENRLVVMKSGW